MRIDVGTEGKLIQFTDSGNLLCTHMMKNPVVNKSHCRGAQD